MEIRKNLVHEQSEGLTCMTPSRTDQTMKDECDVNIILQKYCSTGVLTHTQDREPLFGDFSQVPSDYGEALELMKKSKEMFMELPSGVRDRFDNKPELLVKFLQDEKNKDEAIKLGLVNEPDMADQK